MGRGTIGLPQGLPSAEVSFRGYGWQMPWRWIIREAERRGSASPKLPPDLSQNPRAGKSLRGMPAFFAHSLRGTMKKNYRAGPKA